MRISRVASLFVVAFAVPFTGRLVFWPEAPTPAIVQELLAMAETDQVEWSGPAGARLVVVHLRDFHFVSKDLCELEGISFQDVLSAAASIQENQLAMARQFIKAHGLNAVYSEGLSEESRPALQFRLELLKGIPAQGLEDGGEAVKNLILEVGTPGRLWLAGDIAEILPLEGEQELQDAKPVADGKIVQDEAKIEARRKAMVAHLPVEGLVLVVLGGSHDLGPHFPPNTFYARVTPRSYPK